MYRNRFFKYALGDEPHIHPLISPRLDGGIESNKVIYVIGSRALTLNLERLNLERCVVHRPNVPSFSISSRNRRSISCDAVTCLARGSVLAISSRVACIAMGLISSRGSRTFISAV